MTEQRTAWGWGLASIDAAGNTLDVWYPELTLGEAPAETSRPNHNFGAIAHDEADARGVRRMPVFTVSKLDEPIEDAADAYLRLHLLSMRLAKPNTLNLDGIFAKLNNVVWTNYGPFAVDDFALRKLDVMAATRQSGAVLAPHVDVNVLSIDKFPRMVDYVVPTGVRIGDADRVRLGAHLSEGTTVMHAGFVNFNAGTLGVSMVEGRVSQGVVVGNGSDIGGGASIMGTLSGGGKLKNSIGEHSLLGANAGIGISLGDNCVVEAGLYVTAGTKVTIYDKAKVAAGEPLETVKGAELSGKDNILFIRDSVSGRIEARYRKTGIELNEKLHKNLKRNGGERHPRSPQEETRENHTDHRWQGQREVSARRHRGIFETTGPVLQARHRRSGRREDTGARQRRTRTADQGQRGRTHRQTYS